MGSRTPGDGYARRPERALILVGVDPAVARLFQRQLEGYRVEVASDLHEAHTLGFELKASAIVASLETAMLPGVDVPVIRCPLPHAEQLAQRLGIAEYLVKPVSRDTLLGAIERLGSPIRRVLVVDDDIRFARLMSRMLATADHYQVSTAHNGADALARMHAEPPDLLLLDLVMPELDGVGVLTQMATEPALRDIKVIVVSAYEEGDSPVAVGHEVQLCKPEGFQLSEIIQVIGAAVDRLGPVRAYLPDRAPAPRASRPD